MAHRPELDAAETLLLDDEEVGVLRLAQQPLRGSAADEHGLDGPGEARRVDAIDDAVELPPGLDLETLLVGGSAAGLAFLVGVGLGGLA